MPTVTRTWETESDDRFLGRLRGSRQPAVFWSKSGRRMSPIGGVIISNFTDGRVSQSRVEQLGMCLEKRCKRR